MKIEYHSFMSENSSEQSPNKFSRVESVKTARQNLSKRRDEKQIKLIQKALAYNKSSEPQNATADSLRTESEPDTVKIKSQLMSVLANAAKTEGVYGELFRTNAAEQIRDINQTIGPLLTGSMPTGFLLLPNNLKNLENNPDYDPEAIRVLRSRSRFKADYNEKIRVLARSAPLLRDLMNLEERDLGWYGVSAQDVSYYKMAFKPADGKINPRTKPSDTDDQELSPVARALAQALKENK